MRSFPIKAVSVEKSDSHQIANIKLLVDQLKEKKLYKGQLNLKPESETKHVKMTEAVHQQLAEVIAELPRHPL